MKTCYLSCSIDRVSFLSPPTWPFITLSIVKITRMNLVVNARAVTWSELVNVTYLNFFILKLPMCLTPLVLDGHSFCIFQLNIWWVMTTIEHNPLISLDYYICMLWIARACSRNWRCLNVIITLKPLVFNMYMSFIPPWCLYLLFLTSPSQNPPHLLGQFDILSFCFPFLYCFV